MSRFSANREVHIIVEFRVPGVPTPAPWSCTATRRVPAQSGRRVRKGRRGVGGGCGDALVVEDEAEN